MRDQALDPLLTGALVRVVPVLGRVDDERVAVVLRLCQSALDGPPWPARRDDPPGSPDPPPVPDRWTQLSTLLHDDPETALGLSGQIAETTRFGVVRPSAAVREVWELALPSLLAAAARRPDFITLAPLVRAGVFLRSTSAACGVPQRDSDQPALTALTTRAAWCLAARQRPDGGFGAVPVTLDCAWALAEAAVPGLTAGRREFAVLLPNEKSPARSRTPDSPPATYGGKE